MLQHMWAPLGWLKPCCLGDRLKHPEKLGAVKILLHVNAETSSEDFR